VAGDQPLAAGDFSTWLGEVRRALAGDGGSEVPCGDCTACCRSSQFIHIGPGEAETLAHIPAELLFPAPRLPSGHVVLGYDGNGHCPMLVDDRCSIYEHRPRTCRTYDCRIFAATGIEVDDDQPEIAQRVRRWRFSYATEQDLALGDAVSAAARVVVERGNGSANAVQRALAAIESHEEFC
jgi:Fe-S-cluster containining protein